MNHPCLLKRAQVLKICAISNSTLYRLIKVGAFPEPIGITGKRSVAWKEDDVVKWIEELPRVPLTNRRSGEC